MNTRLSNAPPEVSADDLRFLAASLRGWTMDILDGLEKSYNPQQPRVPAGHANGGQWTDGGGGNGVTLPRRKPGQRPPSPHEGSPYYDPATGIYDPPLNRVGNPLTDALLIVPAVQATRAAAALGQTTLREAAGMMSTLRARLNGTRAAEESNAKIRRAADAVEDFLGGKPDRVILNKKKDLTIIKGDKQFRMDVNNPGPKTDGKTPDDPHFHLQEFRSGKWRDATKEHRLYFKKDP
ncbi:MAG: hypothetical protein ACK4PK_11705 [Alphaproteobacteria bacterium]